MTKLRLIALVLLGSGALGLAFYFGRITGTGSSPGEASSAHRNHAQEESHTEEPGLLTLSPEALKRFKLRTAQVELRAVQQMIEATGSVAPNETRVAHVRPIARGRIHEVYVRLGDQVRPGQPLLSYDNVELGDALGEYIAALAEIKKSNSDSDIARRALERARSLVELGAVARAELLRREAEHRNALAEAESRKAKAAQIEQKLHRFGLSDAEIARLIPIADADYHREASESVLRAPFAGVVTGFNVSPGESIDTGDELMSISDLAVVWVMADVYEKDIRFVREGTKADVRIAAQPDRVFPGKITYVGDVLDPETRTSKVRVEVENPESLLKVEMFATIRIPSPARRPALTVPSESVHMIDREAVVFVKKERGFEKRTVHVGQRAGGRVEIMRGLDRGEVVVTEGSFLLKSEAAKSELGEHEE